MVLRRFSNSCEVLKGVQCGVYFHPSKQQSLAGDPGEENATYGIFGINVDFSRSVQSGSFFHLKDKDLSLGTPVEKKAT